VSGVQERVAADEAEISEVEGDLLSNVAPSSVQDIWNVLDKDDERLQLTDSGDPTLVQACARISQERLWVTRDRSKLGPANPGECLAGRPANNDVYRLSDGPQAEVRANALWSYLWVS
jgi:hypothetical protein